MSVPRVGSSSFGARLRSRREELGWSLERVGVAIGLDESAARARISRYELGVHQPAEDTSQALAQVLGVPNAYLHCEDDRLAELVLVISALPVSDQQSLLESVRQRLQSIGSGRAGK